MNEAILEIYLALESRVAAQTNISWNQDMPEIIKEIVSINKFKELAPKAKY